MIIAFARQGQEIGHFSKDEVPALVASGQILPSDDYWHEGMDEWRKVGDRWPVAKVAHLPTAPVMTMEDVPTSSRSGSALIFWLLAVLLIAGVSLGAVESPELENTRYSRASQSTYANL